MNARAGLRFAEFGDSPVGILKMQDAPLDPGEGVED
jgi:hypothetical protein